MATRRALLVLLPPLGGALVAAALPVASVSAEDWCDVDPPTAIHTPQGNVVVVYVTISGPPEDTPGMAHPAERTSCWPTSRPPGTWVGLELTVPALNGHPHEIKSEVWTGPNRSGRLLARTQGRTGAPLQQAFWLDEP